MMKRILFIALSAFFFNSNAQTSVTINQSHMPSAGDSLRYSIAVLDTSVLLNYQKSGGNQSWNFSSLKAERQNVRNFFKSSKTPYSINNKIAEKLADTIQQQGLTLTDVYEFYTSSSSDYSKDERGLSTKIGSFPLRVSPSYSDKDEIYQFPLKYNDRDSSTFSFSFKNAFPQVYYGSSGYRINEVDAWGTVTTPYGSFNCLRVITDIVSFDSISFNNNNTGMNNHIREYKWLSPQVPIPIIKISGSVIAGIFVPSTVEYRDSVRNVPSIFAPLSIFTASPRTSVLGDTVRFSNNSISINTPSYKWTITPNNFNYIAGTNAQSDNPVVVFTDTGDYDVQLITSNNKGKDTLLRKNYLRVNSLSTGLTKKEKVSTAAEVFPNPTTRNQTVEISANSAFNNINVFDINGRLVYQKQFSAAQKSCLFNPNELQSGTYFIQLRNRSSIETAKLIILQ